MTYTTRDFESIDQLAIINHCLLYQMIYPIIRSFTMQLDHYIVSKMVILWFLISDAQQALLKRNRGPRKAAGTMSS